MTAGHLFIRLDLYIRVARFNTTMKNIDKFPQLCEISNATIFNIINKSNLIPFLMRIQLALLFFISKPWKFIAVNDKCCDSNQWQQSFQIYLRSYIFLVHIIYVIPIRASDDSIHYHCLFLEDIGKDEIIAWKNELLDLWTNHMLEFVEYQCTLSVAYPTNYKVINLFVTSLPLRLGQTFQFLDICF